MSDDPYSEGGVLRNKLGIRDPDELRRAEYDISHARLLTLTERPVEGRLDLDHLRAIHERIFADVYDWAGELRTVAISKGTSAFAFPQFLEPAGNDIFTKLAAENHLKVGDPVPEDAPEPRAGARVGPVGSPG